MLQKIIPSRLKSVLAKRPQGSGGLWRKRVLIVCGIVLLLMVIGHLGIRFVVWPQIEKSKASVERLLSTRIGSDVTIDELKVSWTGIRPQFEMEGLRFNGPEKNKPLLHISKISGELSWNSFYHLAPYFYVLNFSGAEIYAQRNSKGIITIAGIPIHSNSGDHSFENWLFSQDEILVSDVKFFWTDQQDKKATTTLDIQNLSLRNGIRSHKALLTTRTPWNTGPLEIKADFVHRLGGQAGNWRDWIGNVSWNVNELNLTKISQDFSVPLNTLEGILSSQGKLKLDNGQPDGGEAFIAADNLTIQLAKNEDAIALGRLETNVVQENEDGLISITTKTFAWRDTESPKTAPLENLSPMTFRWKPPGADGEIKEFGFSSPKILVEDIALFALNLPLSKKVHQWIKVSEADGELHDLDIHWSESKSPLSALNIPGGWFKSNKLDFSISAKLVNLSFVGFNKSIPSVTNLSGFISGDQKQGTFSLDSKNLTLEINDFLVDPKIQLDQASGQISWSKKRGNWLINAKQLALSNPEINTSLNLSYLIGDPKKADSMTLDMNFAKANLSSAHRYLPLGMGKDARLYLSKAFSAGSIQNGKLHINGDPNEVPFPRGNPGDFTLSLPFVGATFSPAPLIPSNQGVWSAFSNVNGLMTMQNSALSIDIDSANYKQIALKNFHAEIPNVSANRLILSANGDAQGEASQMLEYLFASPFAKKQNKLEKNLQLTGPINLALGLKLPLSGEAETKLDLKLDLNGNKAQWAKLPALENLKGKIRITEVNPEFEDVTANFLGGALRVDSIAASSGQSFSISGDISADFLKTYFANTLRADSSPLLEGMIGRARYEGTLNFNKSGSETTLKFDLRDWASAAPVPAKKLMGTPMQGQLVFKTLPKSPAGSKQFSLTGKFGDLYTLQGEGDGDDELRIGLGINTPAILPQDGFQLNFAGNELNLDAWVDFFGKQKKKGVAPPFGEENTNPIQVKAEVKKLTLKNRIWQDVNLSAAGKNLVWKLRINSPDIAGQIQYQEPNPNLYSGSVSGRLNRLNIPTQLIQADEKKSSAKSQIDPGTIPSLDLVIDDFNWGKAQLGQLKIKTQSIKNMLTLESLQVNNPQGNSVTSGQWRGQTANQSEHSKLNVDMDIKDAGHIIAHWTSQKSIEGGKGKLNANAEWDGSPFAPQYDSLSGKANITLEKGRLLEVNTSGAQILDVLSLQSLFRFATLDLQGSLGNIVTKGTPFNTISASFDVSSGIAQTKQFSMNLDQARVAMTGQINIPKQTQDLRVTIFPTIDATAGSLAAFAINPIVGLGALVGQYLITNQINRNFQSDYLIQGSWENPEVIALDQKGQPIDVKTLDKIRNKELLKEQVKPSNNPAPNTTPQTQSL